MHDRADRIRAAVITISDGVARGERDDESGMVIEMLLHAAGIPVEESSVVPDEVGAITRELRGAIGRVDLVVTTGGTGLAARDVTPEATRAVIDREVPGIAELMRVRGFDNTPLAALSRGIVGSAGASLVVNLPGSPKAVREGLTAALDVIPHAIQLLRGDTSHTAGPAQTES